MPSLGSLWYGVMLKDMTDADLKKIEQKLQNIGIKLDTAKLTESLKKSVESYKGKDLSLSVKEQFLHDAIRAALKQPTFPIKVRVEAASAQQAVRDALQRAGLQRGFTAADKRQYDAETKRLAAMQIANAKAAAASALAQQRLASAHRKATRATNSHTSASISLGTAMRGNIRIAGKLGPMLASVYSIVALKNFMKKVVEIGGELEKQKLAIQAILGDKGFADTITSRINTLAVKSPFGVMELNQYAKQLTAFQIPYNELYETMKRMADVSAAVGVDMGRIILAYGQVRAAKFLKGTELRQFTEANIPLIDMLAQRFTKLKGEVVSAGDIMDMISKKEISFEDVKAVLWELTNEGGRFYNMQEVLSESLQAKWKNLADAVDLMFADMAKELNGPLKSLAELLTSLTKHWASVGFAVGTAAASFGLYKIAMLAVNKYIAENTIRLRFNSIAVGKNVSKWQWAGMRISNIVKGIGTRIKQFITSARGIVTMASVGITAVAEALLLLWQHNREEMEKVKELSDDLMTRAAEGSKNLKQLLDSTPVYGAGMDNAGLTAGIEKMTEAIKNYSRTADRDLMRSLVNQRGEVASLAEQYEALRERLVQLKESMDSEVQGGVGKLLTESINNADSGWFDDNLLTDINDFIEDYEDAQKKLGESIEENKDKLSDMVKRAKEASPAFAAMAANFKTDEQAFTDLIRNYNKYFNDYTVKRDKDINEIRIKYISEYSGSYNQFMLEFQQTVQKQIDRLAMEGIIPGNLSGADKATLVAWFDKVTEGLPEMAKLWAQRTFEGMWQFDLDDGRAEKAVVDQFGKLMESAYPELARKMKAGLPLKEIELIDYSGAALLVGDAANNVMAQMPQFRDKIQGYLDDNTFIARVMLGWQGLNKDSDLKKMLWSSDAENFRVPAFDAEKIFDQMAAGATSTRDVRDNYIKRGKDIKERIKAAKANNSAAEELTKLELKWRVTEDSYRRAHFGSLEEAVKEKGNSSDKDTLAESLKQRFKDIKDAYAMFKEWAKLEGKDAAFKRVGNSGLFATLAPDKVPQTVDEYLALIDELEKELKAAGVKGKSQRETLANDLIKERFGINKDTFKEQLQLALDKVSKEAEKQLADWNLFDKIRKATGNKDLAMNIAFGMNADAVTDYPTMIKKQFNDFAKAANSALTFDTATPEALAEAPTEVQKAWEDATKKLQQYAQQQKDAIADIVSEYQSLQDKLAKIDADRDEKIRKVNESDMSAPEKAQYIQRIKVEADWQKFTQGADYLRFFSGIYSLTMEQAQQIDDKIRLHLDKRLQAGKISAEEYYKEIERINQQLSKLRNVKSDAMTFMTGGVKGLQQKKLEKADSDVLDQMTKVQQAEEALEKAKASGDKQQIGAANAALVLAKQELATREKIRDAIVKDMQAWQNILDVVNIAGNIAGGMSDAFNSIRDMSDAFGVDTESGAWDDIAAVMDTLTSVTGGVQKVVQSAMSGDIGGILSGAVSTITTPFTIWSKLHDKKLQKMIDRSKQAAQIMQNQYDILEKRMASFLGNAANMKVEGYSGEGGAYGKQRELMQGQLAELEKQRQAEIDKKKTDKSVVEDYNKQIEEMKISIRDFAEEAAKDLYEIDLKGWAKQLGDALFEAWKRGEDGAEAFKKKASEIVGTVLNNIFRLNVLEPMMKQLANDLFGEDGQGGIFGKDFELTSDEVLNYVVDNLMKIGDAAEQYGEFMDEANRRYEEKTGQSLKDDESKSGLSAGIQSITEDTADLLASYINSIRASVAMNETRWERLLNDAMPQMNVIAQSQLDTQKQIAENTLRTAQATEWLVKLNTSMESSWRRIAMREWGYQ